jgi:hypothetical protein
VGFTNDLLTGMATYLAAAGIGWTWRPGTAYLPSETGLYLRQLPSSPDRAVALTYYAVDDHPGLTNDIAGVQMRVRGTTDPTVADDLADDAFAVLHGLEHAVFGGVHVAKVWRQSHVALGRDDNQRFQASSNYYLHVARASLHRAD